MYVCRRRRIITCNSAWRNYKNRLSLSSPISGDWNLESSLLINVLYGLTIDVWLFWYRYNNTLCIAYFVLTIMIIRLRGIVQKYLKMHLGHQFWVLLIYKYIIFYVQGIESGKLFLQIGLKCKLELGHSKESWDEIGGRNYKVIDHITSKLAWDCLENLRILWKRTKLLWDIRA